MSELNTGHYFEALDRTKWIAKILQTILLSHPAIEQSEQLTHIITGIHSELKSIEVLLSNKTKTLDTNEHVDDRAYWLFIVINELLINDIVVAKDPNAKLLAEQAAASLWKLYQHLGNK